MEDPLPDDVLKLTGELHQKSSCKRYYQVVLLSRDCLRVFDISQVCTRVSGVVKGKSGY